MRRKYENYLIEFIRMKRAEQAQLLQIYIPKFTKLINTHGLLILFVLFCKIKKNDQQLYMILKNLLN